MVSIFIVIVVLLFAICKNAQPIVGISGGTPANNNNNVVSIRANMLHKCGGAIVSYMWILTAAHCLRIDVEYDVIYGTLQSFEGLIPEPRYYRNIEHWIVHPRFQLLCGRHIFDIGLARVNSQFDFSPNVYPVSLPPKNYRINIGVQVLLLGWGQFSASDTRTPEILQQVSIPIRDSYDCGLLNAFLPFEMCAGGDGENGCAGDSGTPLLRDNLLIAVHCWSFVPCETNPGVYQEIAPYHDWIIETIFPYGES